MSQLSSRISIQLSRFLSISNTLQDSIEGDSENITRHLINTRLDILEDDWVKFRSEHEALCRENSEGLEEQPYLRTRTYERCREFYVQARATLLARQDELDRSSCTTRSSGSYLFISPATTNRRGLPKIDIPKFSGIYNAWRSYRDLFLSMVGNNETLDNVEKMHYLKISLTGDAAKLVVNIEVSEENFAIAWKKLVDRYENKRLLISSHLDRLTNLKQLTSRSARELNSLLSTVSETMDALKALGCTDTWDALLVHQLSRLLDADTRELWEGKIGPTSSYPTLKEFEDFLIGRARTWESLESESKGNSNGKNRPHRTSGKFDNKSRSLVATTSRTPGSLSCQVCKEDHYLYTCPQFKAMTAQRRRRFVTEKRLCFNCFGNHAVVRCSNTRRCLKCGQKHHSLIHDSLRPASETVTSTDVKKSRPENFQKKDDKHQTKSTDQ